MSKISDRVKEEDLTNTLHQVIDQVESLFNVKADVTIVVTCDEDQEAMICTGAKDLRIVRDKILTSFKMMDFLDCKQAEGEEKH